MSGSGIEFFRKFVQRKAENTNSTNSTTADSCKDCQNLFRHLNDPLDDDVYMERLILNTVIWKGGGGLIYSYF